MLIKKAFVLITLFCAMSLASVWGDDFEQLSQELQKPFLKAKVMRVKFSMTRSIPGLTKKIKSSGELLYATQRGLRWQTDFPFKSTYLITSEACYLSTGKKVGFKKQNNPIGQNILKIFELIYEGKMDQLKKAFEIKLTNAENKKWSMKLIPRSSWMAKGLGFLNLEGQGSQISKILLNFKNRGESQIEFAQPEFDPQEILKKISELFEL